MRVNTLITNSDHLPISVELILPSKLPLQVHESFASQPVLRWQPHLAEQYRNHLLCSQLVAADFNTEALGSIYGPLGSAMLNGAFAFNMVRNTVKRYHYRKPWFDSHCAGLKSETQSLLRTCKVLPSEDPLWKEYYSIKKGVSRLHQSKKAKTCRIHPQQICLNQKHFQVLSRSW